MKLGDGWCSLSLQIPGRQLRRLYPGSGGATPSRHHTALPGLAGSITSGGSNPCLILYSSLRVHAGISEAHKVTCSFAVMPPAVLPGAGLASSRRSGNRPTSCVISLKQSGRLYCTVDGSPLEHSTLCISEPSQHKPMPTDGLAGWLNPCVTHVAMPPRFSKKGKRSITWIASPAMAAWELHMHGDFRTPQ